MLGYLGVNLNRRGEFIVVQTAVRENERERGLEHKNQGLNVALLRQKDKEFCKQFHRQTR